MPRHDDFDQQLNDSATEWARTVRWMVLAFVGLIGFAVAYYLGGDAWMQNYAIGLCVVLALSSVYFGIYFIMKLLAGRDTAMAQAFGDLLHAHSSSGAQQAKVVTEVIRGANAINKADADVQTNMMRNYQNIGANYEKRMAELMYQNQQMQQQLRVMKEQPQLTVDDDDDSDFDMPADFHYQLPEMK